MRKIILYIDVYDCQVQVLRTEDEIHSKCKRLKLKPHPPNSFGAACALRLHDSEGVPFFGLYLPKGTAVSRVCHEVVHLAWMILEQHDVKIDIENHEALTYLVECLMRQYHAETRRRKLH